MLDRTQFDEMARLLARVYRTRERLPPDDEHRLRQLLSREHRNAWTMAWDDLVDYGKWVVGLYLVFHGYGAAQHDGATS